MQPVNDEGRLPQGGVRISPEPESAQPSGTDRDAAIVAFQALQGVASFHGLPVSPLTLAREMAIAGPASGEDIVRAARRIGLRARVVQGVDVARLLRTPLPAIARLREGGWVVLRAGGRPGDFGFIDPVTRAQREAPAGQVVDEIGGQLILFTRREEPAAEKASFGWKWFFGALWRYRSPLTHVLVASLFMQLFALVTPLIYQLVIDKVLGHKSASTLTVLILAMVGLGLFGAILQYLRGYAMAHTSSRVDVELGSRLVAHLFRLPIDYFETRPTGATIAQIRELDTIRNFISGQALIAALDCLFMFVAIGVLFVYSTKLTLIVILSIPLYLAVSAAMAPSLRAKLKEKLTRWTQSQQFVVESVVGMHTLKASAVEPIMQRGWDDRFAAYAKSGFEASSQSAAGQSATEFLNKLVTALLLYLGALEVIDGALSVGELIAFNMIARQATQPVVSIARLWHDFQQLGVSLERLGEIFEAPVEKKMGAAAPAPALRGDIELRNVSFHYRSGAPDVLRTVSLTIAAGEVIGVVGASGSGKSTLARLIQRLHAPTAGEILIDGVDIAQMDPGSLRAQMGVVLQESMLFNRTVHENIALARPSLSRQRVTHVAKLAGAHDFISRLPQGYDTPVVERGANLSGGQRQRIAIARALAVNPRILIFDEATSALDYESEQVIQRNMREIVKGRTVIIIAHRLAALRRCDRIVAMDGGEIVEVGAPSELLQRSSGLYAKLWSLQNDQVKA